MKWHLPPFWKVKTEKEFDALAFQTFGFQYENNKIYRSFCNLIKKTPKNIHQINDIPFLPVQSFKTHTIKSFVGKAATYFLSSTTSGDTPSRHYVKNLNTYIKSFQKGFKYFYGDISEYIFIALLPSYLEKKRSSLSFMATHFIKKSTSKYSNTYLNQWEKLIILLNKLNKENKKTILLGVSFALLDLIEKQKFNLKNTIIMETGGMKGRRKEIIREELHQKLKKGLGVNTIHSEYGMTELLSQAYSKKNGIFKPVPWMKIFCRDTQNPLSILSVEKQGAINIIDLANRDSCAFIATDDLGKVYPNGTFEIIGRLDNSDIRGCNLMA